ncbi:IS66 family insertion sequence element accessory protein TnpB [Neobacillus sp. PS3-12]|uniref:IS66 family insertion sequence element accessory protein TnpA n=1 Tax=Neobacillus sp. PS3-12 TaxID=3070677 RepID=UPI0027E12A4C|nr:IS66 family insertion sequence element accessory protein TnpB [Neobacillus sp. PS3-12]WML55170.1 IS66 family insertion sequence element accessory protein TnpB [Neobacillus sp. PS3-12]
MDKLNLRKEWELRITDFKASGQTQTKWCADHELNIHQFRYWLRKFNPSELNEARVSSNSNWLSIDDIDDQTGTGNSLSVKVAGVTIEVKPGYDPMLFLDVVMKLKSLC